MGYYDNETGFMLAGITLEPQPQPPGLAITIIQPRLHLTPKIKASDVVARFVGKTYALHETATLPAMRDCNMTMGARGCGAKTITQTRRVEIGIDEVDVHQGTVTYRGQLRLVHCVDLGQTASGQFRPLDGGPAVPFLLDAVTNKPLPVAGASCNTTWDLYMK
ncbi:hypothetical protein BH11MYX1_BH11MYX1_54230 [soil metagenome]